MAVNTRHDSQYWKKASIACFTSSGPAIPASAIAPEVTQRCDLSPHLQVIRAFVFPWVVLSACVLSLERAIMFRKKPVKPGWILIGKTALANDATDLNQESQFLIF